MEWIMNDDIIFYMSDNKEYKKGDFVNLMIRPEDFKISQNVLKDSIKGIVEDVIYDGAITKLVVDINKKIKIKVTTFDDHTYDEGENIYLKPIKNSIVVIKGK